MSLRPIVTPADFGFVVPALYLSFKGGQVPGAAPFRDGDEPTSQGGNPHSRFEPDRYLYAIANTGVVDFDIVMSLGGFTYHLTPLSRQIRVPVSQFLDWDLKSLLAAPIPVDLWNDTVDADNGRHLRVSATLTVRCYAILHRILEAASSEAGDLSNLANPTDADRILASFRKSGRLYQFDYKVTHLRDVPCRLTGGRLHSHLQGPPVLKLFLYLKLREELQPAQRDDAVRGFVAADYTELVRHPREESNAVDRARPRPLPQASRADLVEIWGKNLHAYFRNYTNLERGLRIQQDIFMTARRQAQVNPSQLEVVRAVRDAIDRYLITANVWDEPREDPNRERVQFHLSNLIGALNHASSLLSPVGYLRNLRDWGYFDESQSKQAAMQIGVGHCGEHAKIAYLVLLALMNFPEIRASLKSVILSGQANVDHAFVIGGFQVRRIVHTTVQSRSNTARAMNARISVMSLADNLPPGVDGFVCDPYLARSAMSQTARGLLDRLRTLRNRNSRTEFVSFDLAFPTSPSPQEVTVPRLPGI